jgi:virulence-associated protein VapD
MYALSFDMEVAKLKEHYGEPYNKAYDEIRVVMGELGFDWAQGSLYIAKSEKNTLTSVYKVINKLSSILWFKESVKDIRAFKVEDWSDFTEVVKFKG